MTIKQQGGIFGRNPTFNDATVDNNLIVNNRIGIGVDNPSDEIVIRSSSPKILFTDSDDDTIGHVAYNVQAMLYNSKSTHRFSIDGDEKVRILGASGDISLLGGGNVIMQSGSGIDFSATSGTGTSELFDDYEEGTWTPATYGASSATISSAEGSYTKIGDMVYASFTFNVDTNSDGAQLRIHGLPYFIGSSQVDRGGVIIGYNNSGTACVGNGVNSSTRFSFSTLTGSDVFFSTFSGKLLRGTYVYSV